MLAIDNILKKISDSTKICNESTYINDADIYNYFEELINKNKFIHVPRYDLEIIYDEDNSNKAMFGFNYQKKKVYFNKSIFFNKYAENENAYEFNLNILKCINKLIAKVELYRKLENPTFSKIEPLFYTYLVDEILDGKSNILQSNYINFRSLYLTSLLLTTAVSDYNLDLVKKLEFDEYCNKEIIKTYNVCDSQTPIASAIDENINSYYNISDELLTKRFNQDVSNNYFTALLLDDNSKSNILNSIMFGKTIENIDKLIEVSKMMSIFDYATISNNSVVNEITRNLTK